MHTNTNTQAHSQTQTHTHIHSTFSHWNSSGNSRPLSERVCFRQFLEYTFFIYILFFCSFSYVFPFCRSCFDVIEIAFFLCFISLFAVNTDISGTLMPLSPFEMKVDLQHHKKREDKKTLKKNWQNFRWPQNVDQGA